MSATLPTISAREMGKEQSKVDQPETPNQRNPPQKRFFNVNIKFLILFPKNKVFRQENFFNNLEHPTKQIPTPKNFATKRKNLIYLPHKKHQFQKTDFLHKDKFSYTYPKKIKCSRSDKRILIRFRGKLLYLSEKNKFSKRKQLEFAGCNFR